MSKTIGIAGLGWLGLPLAQRLLTLGYKVKGSVTSLEKASELQKKGFDTYSLTLSEKGTTGSVSSFLKNVDIIIVMIPPGLRKNTGSDYVLKMTYFLKEIESAEIPKCIFISSTAVYSDEQAEVTEAMAPKPETEAGRQLLQVEQLFFNAQCKSSIVRFGGLIGGSRQPVRYLAGRDNLSGGNAPVNLIHREDCIAILLKIIQKDAYGHIFNAVNPQHPIKKEYYIQKAQELTLDLPSFSEDFSNNYKKVDSINLPNLLEYTFQRDI
ncbi:MAG: NAD(P)-binding domain-containing protein [Flavobacteriaceae bacterium]